MIAVLCVLVLAVAVAKVAGAEATAHLHTPLAGFLVARPGSPGRRPAHPLVRVPGPEAAAQPDPRHAEPGPPRAAARARGTRPGLSAGCGGAGWPRTAVPGRPARRCPSGARYCRTSEHSYQVGRAYRSHPLLVPSEENAVFLGPPRSRKSGAAGADRPALAGPGAVHQHQARRVPADLRYPLAAGPGPRHQPAAPRRAAVLVRLGSGAGLPGPGGGHPPGRCVRRRDRAERGGVRATGSGAWPASSCGRCSARPRSAAGTCAPSRPGPLALRSPRPRRSCAWPGAISSPRTWSRCAARPARRSRQSR